MEGPNLCGANLEGGETSPGRSSHGADLHDADLLGGAGRFFLGRTGAGSFTGRRRPGFATDLANAVLTGCRVYGISAWDLKVSEGTKQQDLVITRLGEPEVTVDNIEVAQFVYLLLHNEKIRDVIDTIGRKGVLLLGPFTEGRIAVLAACRT